MVHRTVAARMHQAVARAHALQLMRMQQHAFVEAQKLPPWQDASLSFLQRPAGAPGPSGAPFRAPGDVARNEKDSR